MLHEPLPIWNDTTNKKQAIFVFTVICFDIICYSQLHFKLKIIKISVFKQNKNSNDLDRRYTLLNRVPKFQHNIYVSQIINLLEGGRYLAKWANGHATLWVYALKFKWISRRITFQYVYNFSNPSQFRSIKYKCTLGSQCGSIFVFTVNKYNYIFRRNMTIWILD